MIQKRSLTVTLELPEDLWNVLEDKALRENRPMAEVIAEYKLKQYPPRPLFSAEEAERRHREFVAMIGSYDSGYPNSCDNERIDQDLAREYGSGL